MTTRNLIEDGDLTAADMQEPLVYAPNEEETHYSFY
jgi:hypothetical protein